MLGVVPALLILVITPLWLLVATDVTVPLFVALIVKLPPSTASPLRFIPLPGITIIELLLSKAVLNIPVVIFDALEAYASAAVRAPVAAPTGSKSVALLAEAVPNTGK